MIGTVNPVINSDLTLGSFKMNWAETVVPGSKAKGTPPPVSMVPVKLPLSSVVIVPNILPWKTPLVNEPANTSRVLLASIGTR